MWLFYIQFLVEFSVISDLILCPPMHYLSEYFQEKLIKCQISKHPYSHKNHRKAIETVVKPFLPLYLGLLLFGLYSVLPDISKIAVYDTLGC